MNLLLVIIVLLLLFGGLGWGWHSSGYYGGPYLGSGVGLVLVVLLVLFIMGRI